MSGKRALTPKQIQWAYEKYCQGYTQLEISQALYVNERTVQRALFGKPRIRPLLTYDGEKTTNREKLLDVLSQISNKELANSIDLFCSECPATETCRATLNSTCQEVMMLWLESDEQVK